MRHLSLALITILVVSTARVAAQTITPAGHWEGSATLPEMSIEFELDFAADSGGTLIGAFTQPSAAMKGFPLVDIAVAGSSLRFVLKTGEGARLFQGVVAADGQSITGDVRVGDFTVPFVVTRKGDARMPAVPANAAVSPALEGRWHGSLDVGGRDVELVLTIANQPDAHAVATIVSPNGSAVEIAVTLTQSDGMLTIEVPPVSARYSGAIAASGAEIVGTWMQGGEKMPLTFRRARE